MPVLTAGEHPVDHAAVKVHMRIQCAAKALHKAHRAQPPARAAAALTQPRLDDPQKDVQHRTERLGVALQEVAQALAHRQYPLAHRQRREDLVSQMSGGLRHAPRVARWAHATAFAGKRNQKIVSALPAADAGEAVGQDAAFEIAAKLPLHVLRHASQLSPAGVRAIGSAMVDAGFDKTRIVLQQWNRNFQPSQIQLDGRIPDLFMVSSMSLHSEQCMDLIRDAHRINPRASPADHRRRSTRCLRAL